VYSKSTYKYLGVPYLSEYLTRGLDVASRRV